MMNLRNEISLLVLMLNTLEEVLTCINSLSKDYPRKKKKKFKRALNDLKLYIKKTKKVLRQNDIILEFMESQYGFRDNPLVHFPPGSIPGGPKEPFPSLQHDPFCLSIGEEIQRSRLLLGKFDITENIITGVIKPYGIL